MSEKMNLAKKAESLATEYLLTLGYAIKERNWRPQPSHYEVDIIAQDGTEMVFVEVKARTVNDPVSAVEAVDMKKQRFIARAADIFLRQQAHTYYYRFDIIAIFLDEVGHHITHIKDAFLPPLSSLGRK